MMEARSTAAQRGVERVQRLSGLRRLDSNAVVVSGSRTASGNPMLYGGPQTGFAAPGYFWEVELHDPRRDQRGVMVPAVPLLLIRRNADAAWGGPRRLPRHHSPLPLTPHRPPPD